MKRHTLTRDIVFKSMAASTKESFALEGRVVPPDFIRSEAVEKWLEERYGLPEAQS